MLPVRAPIQVTLEDTGGAQVHCTRRAAQVKILRRPPKTLAKQQASGSSAIATEQSLAAVGRQSAAAAAAAAEQADHRLQLDDPFEWPQPNQEWPQLNPASHKQQHQQAPKKPEKLYSAIHTKSHQNLSHKSPATTNNNDTPPAPPAPPAPNSFTRHPPNKPPLKTYQERADEYAKARLRILGSAFPDDDQQQDDGPQVDVFRLLDPSSSSLLSPSTDTPGAVAAATFNNGNNTDNNNSSRINNKIQSTANNFYPDSNRARQSR